MFLSVLSHTSPALPHTSYSPQTSDCLNSASSQTYASYDSAAYNNVLVVVWPLMLPLLDKTETAQSEALGWTFREAMNVFDKYLKNEFQFLFIILTTNGRYSVNIIKIIHLRTKSVGKRQLVFFGSYLIVWPKPTYLSFIIKSCHKHVRQSPLG